MVYEHADEKSKEKGKFFENIEWRKWVIGTLIGLIPIFLLVNDRYLDHFDKRYVLRTESITLAQAEIIKQEVAEAKSIALNVKSTMEVNAKNLNEVTHDVSQLASSFEAYAAVATVSNLRQALDRKEADDDSVKTLIWREDRDRLKRQLKQAEDKRDCILAQRINCQILTPDGK